MRRIASLVLALMASLASPASPSWAVDDDPQRAPEKDRTRATVAPPSNLAARQTSPNEIRLTWQRVPGAVEYRV